MLDGVEDVSPRQRQPRLLLAASALALAAVVAGAIGLAIRIVDAERERDLRIWQDRLAVVADSRAEAVGQWLGRQLETVVGLAQNASLQLYVTELALAEGHRSGVTDEIAQAAYLRNLLIVTADRTGFASARPAPQVGANVQRAGVAGLAIVDAQGRVLVATPDMPFMNGPVREFLDGSPDRPAVLDMFAGADGAPTMAFFAPVFGIQAEPGGPPVAGIIGIKPVGAELFPILGRPRTTEKSAESLLVRRVGAVLEFVSPTAEGDTALERQLPADTPGLAEGFAVRNPGGFSVLRDYRDRKVLVTGRAIAHVPWTLVHKVDRTEALAESDARRNRIVALLLLGVGLVVAGLIAAWRHGASRRATATAERLKTLTRRLERQADLLRIVTDSQPAAILILDDQERIRFANRVVAERAGVTAGDLIGKALSSALGPAEASRHRRHLRETLLSGVGRPAIQRLGEEAGARIVHVEYIPLSAASGEEPGVLVVEEDITAPILERERRERTQRHLVRTLVALLDRRDPFAANHSQRVSTLARCIAEEMGLGSVDVETAEIAGSLMNIGKILVSPEVLTRSDGISDDQLRQIRQSLQAGAELLEGIEFDGPVVDTLRQAQERYDGNGPGGLRGEKILVTAQVIAVANAFVALVSPRAHRPGVSLDGAIAHLLEQCGQAFDRRVVAALINYLENRGGRECWRELAQSRG